MELFLSLLAATTDRKLTRFEPVKQIDEIHYLLYVDHNYWSTYSLSALVSTLYSLAIRRLKEFETDVKELLNTYEKDAKLG